MRRSSKDGAPGELRGLYFHPYRAVVADTVKYLMAASSDQDKTDRVRSKTRRVQFRIDRSGASWGLLAVAAALAIGAIGSGGLRWFDAALSGYLAGTLFAIFGTVYRYRVWLQRPPTAR